jgi:hypothetical protein
MIRMAAYQFPEEKIMTSSNLKKQKNESNVFLRNDYNNKVILQIIETLVEKRILRKSDKLIWSMFFSNSPYQEKTKINGRAGVSIDINRVINALKGDENPDFKTGRIINYSRQSRAVKIKKYIEIGLLSRIEDSAIDYEVGYPTSAQPIQTLNRNKKYIKKKNNNKDLQLISTEAIEKLGTIQAISNYIGRCVRLTDKIKTDVIKTKFLVKSQSDEELNGVLEVEATSLKNTSIVVADDLLLVDYIYSMIRERLDERTDQNQSIIENKFTFDLADVARDFYKGDSGPGRTIIYNKILRISSTEYTISVNNNAIWLMSRLGFVTEDGAPFKKARLRWLSLSGEQSEYFEAKTESTRYVTISLPDFIINNLNQRFNNKPNILPMFKRDKIMLKGKSAGIIWTLNNYLMTMLPVSGYINGPVMLNKFLQRWQPYLDNETLLQPALQAYLKAIVDKNTMLYVDSIRITQAKKVSLQKVFSLVGSFLIKTTNITPYAKQIRTIKYELTAIRLNVADIAMCRKQIEDTQSGVAFSENPLFEKKLNLIISKGGKHNVDKKLLKS